MEEAPAQPPEEEERGEQTGGSPPIPVLERGSVLAPLPVSSLVPAVSRLLPTANERPERRWWRTRLSLAAALGLAAFGAVAVLGLQRLVGAARPDAPGVAGSTSGQPAVAGSAAGAPSSALAGGAPTSALAAAPSGSASAPPASAPAPVAPASPPPSRPGTSVGAEAARAPRRPAPRTSQHFASAFARKENDLLRCFARFAEPGAATAPAGGQRARRPGWAG